ncbi:MAG: glycosyltransferase involved in cell wall biosynthesis [Candidatus Promineifilaceae bacterium]
MKILSIIHRYHPAVGGAESYMGTINKMLVGRGHQVTVLTTDAADFELFWNRSAKRFTHLKDSDHGVEIVRFPVRHLPFPKYAFPATRLATAQISKIAPNSRLADWMTTLTPFVPAMRRWLESTSDRFDAVLGTTITLEGILKLGQQFAHKQNIPFIVFPLVHLGGGSAPGTEPISRFYTLPQQQQLVLAADGLVAINPAEQAFYMVQGMAEEKTTLAPPALVVADLVGGDRDRWRKRFNIHPETPVVCTVSALAKDKGAIQTVEALRHLWRAGHRICLAMAGTPMADFRAYLADIPADEKEQLLMLGKVSNQDRNDLLAAADIFCMPSVVESFGLAFAEAMFFKKPVIGGNVWGVKGFVIRPGENGFLVDSADVTGLAERIEQLVNDPRLAQKLGAAGYEFVTHELSWKKSIDQIERLLHKLTGLKGDVL